MRSDSPERATLFSSVTAPRFLGRFWPRRPVWNHGAAQRLGRLTELDQIGHVIALAVRSHVEMKAVLSGTQHDTNEIPISHSSALSLYDSGATIAFNEIHRWHDAVGDWVECLARDLSVPRDFARCNLYLSPRGSGVSMHFDDHEVIVVQLAGRKRWRFAENRTVINPIR